MLLVISNIVECVLLVISNIVERVLLVISNIVEYVLLVVSNIVDCVLLVIRNMVECVLCVVACRSVRVLRRVSFQEYVCEWLHLDQVKVPRPVPWRPQCRLW